MSTELLLYSDNITSRLKYAADEILLRRCGVSYRLTNDRIETEKAYKAKVICYSENFILGAINIRPDGLLSEIGIRKPDLKIKYKGIDTLLFADDTEFGFDIFSAVFFLLSRYEEYKGYSDVNDFDKHNRYRPQSSVLSMCGCIDVPIVDIWAAKLRESLEKTLGLKTSPVGYRHISTIDIDNIYKYRNKGFFRHTVHSVIDILKGRRSSVVSRIRCLLHIDEDPYFNIAEVLSMTSQNRENTKIFFHCGMYGKFDKKTIFPSLRYRKVRRESDKVAEVGLHPSYRSAGNAFVLKSEKRMLEYVIDRGVTISRYHYLKFRLPESYRTLIGLGVKTDYSMAYSDIPGYRAGTAASFRFYDIEKESETSLEVVPLAVMDKTLKSNLGLDTEQALKKLEQMSNVCREYSVPFVTLFHNQNLTGDEEWTGWNNLFEKIHSLLK